MTPERLAEIRQLHRAGSDAHDATCVTCDLLTALREAQQRMNDLFNQQVLTQQTYRALSSCDPGLTSERDALQRQYNVAGDALNRMIDKNATLQRRVEGLEKATREILPWLHHVPRCVKTFRALTTDDPGLPDVYNCGETCPRHILEDALRGGGMG